MSAWAKPGVRCVCISKTMRGEAADWAVGPIVGEIYTIDRAEVGIHGIFAISLVELPTVNPETGDEFGFDVTAFRPLAYRSQSLEHDAEVFRKIAAQLPAPSTESVE